MAQGPGAPSLLADSEVFLQKPSTQLLPLWLPASPWLPAETLLPQPLRWKELPPHEIEALINIRWTKKQREKKIQRASPSKEVLFPQFHPYIPCHISLINVALTVFLSEETWNKLKGQMDVVCPFPSALVFQTMPGTSSLSCLMMDSLQELMRWP